jgi:hypothetical protein
MDIFNVGRAAVVAPSDVAPLATTTALYIGVAGDVCVDMDNGGTAVVFKAHPVGYMYARVNRVLSTGTTATNILALY